LQGQGEHHGCQHYSHKIMLLKLHFTIGVHLRIIPRRE
jgi:hypothetical protein